MTDIVEFLAARLDEDEALALEAADRLGGQWFVGRKWNVYAVDDGAWRLDESDDLVAYGDMKSRSEHIARHDPARVLADVKAKRRVLERHGPMDREWVASQRAWHDEFGGDSPFEPKSPSCFGCGTRSSRGGRRGQTFVSHPRTRDFTKCPELLDLAAPYAEHPDYDPAWRVE